jgi:hypothetical protein
MISGQQLAHDTPADAPPPEDWANFVDDWADSQFDAASISVTVDDLNWQQSAQRDEPGTVTGTGSSVIQRTLFLSLRRVLKLFKSQSRAMLLQRAFYTWHNVLRMRERRRWITSFCQKM